MNDPKLRKILKAKKGENVTWALPSKYTRDENYNKPSSDAWLYPFLAKVFSLGAAVLAICYACKRFFG